MSQLSVATVKEQRCAPWTRTQGVNPIGSAGSYAGLLLIEWPLPWPRDIGEIEEFAPLHSALKGTNIRMQAIVAGNDTDQRRVALYRAPVSADGFQSYRCIERTTDSADPVGVVDAALALLAAPLDQLAESSGEVLVCTHGKRDVCCGSLG